MKKGFSAIICLVLIAVMLVGCGNGGNDSEKGEASDKKIAYYAYSTEPYINLDPSVEYSNGIIVLQNVYETLTRYDYKTQKLKPVIAENWKASEDGKTWVFNIRKGITFHDGEALNGEAVKKSIERTKNMNLGAAFIWDSVESIEVTGEYEVTFNLKYPAPIDLIASAGYAAYIISPNAVDKDSEWFNEGNDAGSGPYKIMKITKGEEVVFQKFDKYWGGWKEGQYSNAVIKKVAEGSARRQLLEKGEALFADRFSNTDLKALRQNENLLVENKDTWRNVIGFFNTEKPPLDNVDFRKALSYAFPYEEAVVDVREGQAKQSFGLVPPGLWGHDESIPQYKFDLDKAKEYLKKSGVDPNGLKLEMTFTSGTEAYRNFAQLYQINLKKLGIDLEIREMNWDNVWEKSKNTNPQDRQDILVMNWWPDYASPISWFTSLVKSEENITFNLSYIKDPKLDSMIEEAENLIATDREKAEKILVDVQKEVVDKSYFINIYDDQSTWVVNKKVKGFESNPAYEGVIYFYDLYTE